MNHLPEQRLHEPGHAAAKEVAHRRTDEREACYAHVLLDRLFHGVHVSSHELVDGRAEDLREEQQALDVGVGLVILPA